MVAVRKVPSGRSSAQPAIPPPATPRASKTKAERESANSNKSNAGTTAENVKHNKPKMRNKSKKSKKHAARSLADVLSQILLFAFTIYSLSVCPNDDSLEKPICRGLSAYRKIILEPYVFPPLQQFVIQPVRRQVIPFVAQTLNNSNVQPYVAKYVAFQDNWVLPAAYKSADVWTARVVPQWRERIVPAWKQSVVPQWEKRVVPAFNTHVVPRWNVYVVDNCNRYITPRYERYVYPWVVRAQLYQRQVNALKRSAQAKYVVFEEKSRPYTVFAIAKLQDAVVKLRELYVLAKPYLEHMRVILMRAVNVLKAQRVTYVDPHVAKLWAKMIELSSSGERRSTAQDDFKIQAESPGETVIISSITAAESATSVVIDSVVPSETRSTSVLETSSGVDAETVTDALAEPSTVDAAIFSSTNPTVFVGETSSTSSSSDLSSPISSSVEAASSTEASGIQSATSVVLASVQSVTTAASEVVESIIDKYRTDRADTSLITAPSRESELPVTFVNEDEDAVLKAFFAEFELGGSTPQPSAEQTQQKEYDSEQAAIDDTEAQRINLEATAAKRASINARHSSWEQQLLALIDKQRNTIRTSLVTVRNNALDELHGKTTAEKDGAQLDARALVDLLISDGEKFLKGIEGYLKSISTKRGGDYAKWAGLVEKVDAKFGAKVTELEGEVHQWYVGVLEQELQLARDASAIVKQLAEQAQGDIGLDYAWLDDVTYQDWQRYHDLVRTSERFDIELAFIQNGSVSDTYPGTQPTVASPLLEALDELQAEVQDVVLGFQTRLRGIKRAGERAFKNGSKNTEEDLTEPTVSVVPLVAERVPVPASAVEAEPSFSILPIQDQPTNTPMTTAPTTGADAQGEFARAILGRGENEVLEALRRAEGGRVEL